MHAKPFLIEFPKIGNSALGYISVAERKSLPFEVKRIYWTYFTPESVVRGGHAHLQLEQILVAVAGKIILTTQMPGEEKVQFTLDSANWGLFIPKLCWREMQYTHNAVQMCLASLEYDENEYIRDYQKFNELV